MTAKFQMGAYREAQRAAERKRKEPNGAYALRPGFSWNPLRAHRNLRCPCDSGRKVKRCCGLFEAVPTDVAANLTRYLETLE